MKGGSRGQEYLNTGFFSALTHKHTVSERDCRMSVLVTQSHRWQTPHTQYIYIQKADEQRQGKDRRDRWKGRQTDTSSAGKCLTA